MRACSWPVRTPRYKKSRCDDALWALAKRDDAIVKLSVLYRLDQTA